MKMTYAEINRHAWWNNLTLLLYDTIFYHYMHHILVTIKLRRGKNVNKYKPYDYIYNYKYMYIPI